MTKLSEKSIKLTTIIISVAVIISIIGSFIGGMAYKTYDTNRISNEVKAQVTEQVQSLTQK